MHKHQDGQDTGTGGGFGKKGLEGKQDRQTKHIDDKDFKKGKGTAEERGDEDEA